MTPTIYLIAALSSFCDYFFMAVTLLCFKILCFGAGEMTQWLKALGALPEDPGSVPKTLILANSGL